MPFTHDPPEPEQSPAPLGENRNACAEMIKALMQSTPDFIFFKDLLGKFVSVSNVCATYANTTVEDMIGKTDFDFLPRAHAEELLLEEKKIIATGEPVRDKLERRLCPRGSEIWVSVTKFPWRDSKEEIIGIIGVCREVTERVERERHILNMLSIATHDIRGPLSSIGSTVKLLARGAFGTVDESARVTLLDLYARISRLERLVNEYLCKSSVMNVKMPDREYFDLRQDIIDPILDEFSQEIERNMIRIDNRLGAIPGNRIIIMANAQWIRIVYRNLIRNAINYAASGHIAFGFEEKDDHYRLNVYNSGPPIPEEKRAAIFEQFESNHSTGLGLAISRDLIRKHGGDMWYEHTWDNHPNFIFTIPK